VGNMTEEPFELGLLTLLLPRRSRLGAVFSFRHDFGGMRWEPGRALALSQKGGEGRLSLRLSPVRAAGPFKVVPHYSECSPQLRMATAAKPGLSEVGHSVGGVHPGPSRHFVLPARTGVLLKTGKHVLRLNLPHNEAANLALNHHVDPVC